MELQYKLQYTKVLKIGTFVLVLQGSLYYTNTTLSHKKIRSLPLLHFGNGHFSNHISRPPVLTHFCSTLKSVEHWQSSSSYFVRICGAAASKRDNQGIAEWYRLSFFLGLLYFYRGVLWLQMDFRLYGLLYILQLVLKVCAYWEAVWFSKINFSTPVADWAVQ